MYLKFLNTFINWVQIEWQLNGRKTDPWMRTKKLSVHMVVCQHILYDV